MPKANLPTTVCHQLLSYPYKIIPYRRTR